MSFFSRLNHELHPVLFSTGRKQHCRQKDTIRLNSFAIFIALFCLITPTFLLPASAATTEIRVVKYAVDEFTILAEKTVDYRWMEQNLHVYGDGVTHYYHQGPVFVDDPDPAKEEALRWNPAEDTNVQEKDMGAVKGTNLKDLCELVGGMEPGEKLKIRSSDGWYKLLPYENVYEYSSREGPIILCWNKNGQYPDTGYTDGMRMVWFADTSTNPWGIHAFGVWDWHEAADSEYWYYYQSGEEKYPTTTGLSGMYVSEVLIYSQEEPTGSINVTSTPAGADIFLDGDETGEITPFIFVDIPAGSHSLSVQRDGYQPSMEEWIEVSHGLTVPVHFVLEREYSSLSGSSDSSFSHDTQYDWEQGSLGVAASAIKGNISVHIATGESQVCRSGQTLSYTIPTGSLSPDLLSWARLCVFSHGGYTSDHELEIRVNEMKPGIPERSTYSHGDGKVSETLGFNITPMVRTEGPIGISIKNPPGGNEWTIYPPVLLASCEDGGMPAPESWVAEGAGSVYSVKEYSPQDLQNITVSDFSGIRPGFSHAELMMIGTTTEDPDTSSPMVFQNSVLIPGEYTYHHAGIMVARFNVTATVSEYTHNELFWKAVAGKETIEVGPRLMILTVAYPTGSAKTERESDTPSIIEPVRAEPTVHDTNLSSPATQVVTSPAPDVPGKAPGLKIQDDSFLSQLWRLIFGIFGVPLPEYETQGQVLFNEGNSGQDFPDQGEPGGNATFSTQSTSPPSVTHPLHVSTTPPGALLSFSGQTDVKTAPATFVLAEGDYLLEAEMDGYLACQTMVHLTGAHEISLVLSPEAPGQQSGLQDTPARSRHGGLLIITYPGELELSVDNKPMASKSPLVLYGLKEGYHTVKATRPSATAGKGETLISRAWVYHDALTVCELDFVSARLDRTIRITDPSGNSTSFTLNGMYPLLRPPVTLEIPGTGSFVTLFGEGTYTSIPLQDSLGDSSGFFLPAHAGEYHTISIESSPPGAEIFIDGARTGNVTPSLVSGLSEGPHRVMVSLPGHMPMQRVLSIPRTQEDFIKGTLSFILETYPCGPLRVESIPDGAIIYLDGIATGEKTPCSFTGIPVGVHELTLKSGEITRSRDITIRPDNPNRYVVGME